MNAIQLHRRSLGGVSITYSEAFPQPLMWFDTESGLSSDLSTWTDKTSTYTATQPDASKRFTKVGDSRPSWLQCNGNQFMSIPNVAIHQYNALTVLMLIELADGYLNAGLPLLSYPQATFYSYQGKVEFFLSDGGGGGSNPPVPYTAGEYAVLGGDATLNYYPSTRSFHNYDLNQSYNRYGYAPAGGFTDGTWYIGAEAGGFRGRIRGLLLFPFQLSDNQRNSWVSYLLKLT